MPSDLKTVFRAAGGRRKKNPETDSERLAFVRSDKQKDQHNTAEARRFIFRLALFDHGGKTIAAAGVNSKVEKWMSQLMLLLWYEPNAIGL